MRRHAFSLVCLAAILVAGSFSPMTAWLSSSDLPRSPPPPSPFSPSAFPSRPIRLLVPFEASGTVDVLTRTLAPIMAEDLGQPVVVENKAGTGGIVGIRAAVQAAPDGYTLVVASAALSAQAIGPARLPFDPSRDLSPVAPFATIPCFILVNAAAPADTLAELIASARNTPGGLTYASSGFGSSAHVAGARFGATIGTKLLHVPYRAKGPAINDLIAGHVDMMFVGLPTNAGYLKSAKLKALAVAAPTRVPLLPEVPTVAQAGGPEFSASSWLGILAPRGTPIALRLRLADAIHKALRRPELGWLYAALGALPLEEGVEQFEARFATEIETYRLLAAEHPGILD